MHIEQVDRRNRHQGDEPTPAEPAMTEAVADPAPLGVDEPPAESATGTEAGCEAIATCASCGAAGEPTWVFCECCGREFASVLVAEATHGSAAAGSPAEGSPAGTSPVTVASHPLADRQPPRESPAAPAVATAAAGVAGISVGGGRRTWSRRTMVSAGAALAGVGVLTAEIMVYVDTRSDLARTRSALASTQRQLVDTTSRLHASEASLAKAQSDLRAQISKLQASQRELAGVRGSLGEANSRINMQASQIETLKSCLNGVSSALYYVGQYDGSAAVAALQAVEVSCERAYAIL